MLYRLLKELAFSFALCIGERMLERWLLPGLHLTAGRMVSDDPARADSLTALISEALALMALIWLFTGSLYVIGWLSRRPLRWQVPPLLAIAVVVLTFAGSFATWSTLHQQPTTTSGAH